MPDISLTEFTGSLIEIMTRVSKGFMKYHNSRLLKGRITIQQLFVLDHLAQSGEIKMKELAVFIGVTTATMTGVINRLVRDGYVARVYDPLDRRVIRVKLTSKASNLIKQFNEERRKAVTNVFSQITAQERSQYLNILNKISEIVNKG